MTLRGLSQGLTASRRRKPRIYFEIYRILPCLSNLNHSPSLPMSTFTRFLLRGKMLRK